MFLFPWACFPRRWCWRCLSNDFRIAHANKSTHRANQSSESFRDMSKWDAAQVALEIARDFEEAYSQGEWLLHYQAQTSGGPPIPDAVEAEAERRSELRCVAEDVLIAVPSPDLSTAIWKIEYARERWVDFEDWPDTWWTAVLSDLRRFAL